MVATQLKDIIKRAYQYKTLAYELVDRDLKVKYRRSFLGYLWSLLNPLMMMTVMTIVFSYMFRFDIENFPLYLIIGQTLWNAYSESTTMAMDSIISNGSLIKKVYIPKFIFPISCVMSSFVTVLYSMVAIFIVAIFTGVRFTPYMLLIIFPIGTEFIFACGMGMILAALAPKYRDLKHLYGVITLAWMYLTPIFYPISQLPPQIAIILKINPMYHYITCFRNFVLYGKPAGVETVVLSCIYAAVSFLLGLIVFKKMQNDFILYV